MPDGLGGFGLAAKISGFHPFHKRGGEGFRDARSMDEDTKDQGSEYVADDPDQGRWNVASSPNAPEEPPLSPSGDAGYSKGDGLEEYEAGGPEAVRAAGGRQPPSMSGGGYRSATGGYR